MSALSTWAERARIGAAACLLVAAGVFTYQAGTTALRGTRGTLRAGQLPAGTMEDPQRPLRVEDQATPLTAGEPSEGTGALMQLLVDTPNAAGANVVVDGATMGHAPWAGDVSCTAGAEVQIRIESRGFATHLGRVRCAPGQTVRVNATLRRLRVQ